VKLAMFDDYVPHADLGAGLPRANSICNDLVGRCERLAFFAMHGAGGDSPERWYRDLDRRMEIHIAPVPNDWTVTLERLAADGFDTLWVSRPPNARRIFSGLAARPGLRERFRIIYDAEALYAPRTVAMMELMGRPMAPVDVISALGEEYSLARSADVLVSVSPGEAKTLHRVTGRPTAVIGFTSLAQPLPASFAERSNFGFVGPMRRSSPNEDSLLWYGANVMHEVANRTGARLRVVGKIESQLFSIYAGYACELLGQVDSLAAFFNEIRAFIAPTRFAAGMPQKLIDAASAGVPIVATSLLAEQLGWADGVELLVADSAHAFADACARIYTDEALWQRLRENAVRRIRERYGPGMLAREIDGLFTFLHSTSAAL
jgi:glycosyltransferase involved in cell wall biosynthesis